jgi:hypothetical protein
MTPADAAPPADPDRPSRPLTGWEGPAPRGPLTFEGALAAGLDIAVVDKQRAYELSYALLADGPAGLAAVRGRLVAAVARIGADRELPVALGIELFAYRTAAFMARRRQRDPFDAAPPGGR